MEKQAEMYRDEEKNTNKQWPQWMAVLSGNYKNLYNLFVIHFNLTTYIKPFSLFVIWSKEIISCFDI